MSVRVSLTATLPRLRRPLAMALLSLIGMLTLGVVLPMSAAYATGPLSAPDSFGASIVCNTNLFHDTSVSPSKWRFWWACNYGKFGTATPFEGMQPHYQQRISGTPQGEVSITRFAGDTGNLCAAAGGFTNDRTAKTMTGCFEISDGNAANTYEWLGFKERQCTASTCSSFTDWAGRFQSQGAGDGVPSLPTDWYSGGSAPPVADANPGTSACSRTLTDTNAMTGAFSTSRSGMANATATQAVFAWGDATSNTTVTGAGPWQANHTYGAISTQPANGWTEVTTFTVTANSGHLFSDGSTTFTGTCSLRVDFLNPNASTAGSTGGSSTGDANGGDTGLDSCIPSGWNILNPVALIGGVGCMLKKLFIPTSATSSSLSSMWTGITSKAPFSVLYEVVTFVPQNLDDFVYAVNATSPVVSHGIGGPDTSPICASDNATTHNRIGLCDYSGTYPFEGGGPFRVDGGTGHVSDPNVYLVRQISLFALGLLFFYACYRGVGEILK